MASVSFAPTTSVCSASDNTDPVDVTCSTHPFSTGDVVLFADFDEMTQLNNNYFNVIDLDANSLTLRSVGGVTSIDGTAWIDESTGGRAILGLSAVLDAPAANEDIRVTITGSFVALIHLEVEHTRFSDTWKYVQKFGSAGTFSFKQGKGERYRLRTVSLTSGTATCTLEDLVASVPADEVITTTQAGATVTGTLDVTGAVTATGLLTATAGMPSGTVIGNLTLADGSITDSGGAIDFGNEALTTLGTAKAAGNLTTLNVGGTPATVTAVEYGDGYNHVTVLTVTAAVLVADLASAALEVGALIYTFPAGVHRVNMTHLEVTAASVAADTGNADLGCGSTLAVGANTTLQAATDEDFINGLVVADMTTPSVNVTEVGDGTVFASGDSKLFHINVASDWSGSNADPSITGTVTIAWTYMGA